MVDGLNHRVLWDWPHKDDINGVSFDSVLNHSRAGRLAARLPAFRAIVLWRLARRYEVLVIGLAGGTTRSLLLLERLFPTSRRYIVLLHFIPEVSLASSGSAKVTLLNRVKLLNLRVVVRPVVQRAVLRFQVLTKWEVDRNADYFNVPVERMCLTPYPLRLRRDQLSDDNHDGGVFASGRAACDWPTVFAAASSENWPLTVVCGARDLKHVQQLNRQRRATVLVDVPASEHERLMRSATVYLLALRDNGVSSGQIRLSDAVRAGTPVVLSDVPGISEYVVPEETALVYPPGDVIAAASQMRRLISDPILRRELRSRAFERAGTWTRDEYRSAMHGLVESAAAEATTAVARTRP